MRTLEQIKADIAAKNKDITPLAELAVKGEIDGDKLVEFRRIKGELESLHGEMRDVESVAADAKWVTEFQRQMGQSTGSVTAPVAPGEREGLSRQQGNDDRPQYRSLGEAFARSEQLTKFKQRLGQNRPSDGFRIGSSYPGHQEELNQDPEAREKFALINTTTVSVLIEPQRRPDIIVPDRPELRVRGLFPQGTTQTNTIEFVREDTRTNNAAEVAEATNLSTGLKPESGFTLAEDSVQVRTIAHLMYATRSSLDDVGQLRLLIDQFLLRGIEERVDRQLLLGNGVAPNLKGLLSYSVNVLDSTYWSANPLEPDANRWDALMRAITVTRITGRGRATGIVLSPNDMERAVTAKDAQGRYLFPGGGPFGAGVFTMWGRPVTEQEDLADGRAVVGDFQRAAAVIDRMDSQIFASDSNRDLFERNIITILCEARLAFPVYRPGVFCDVDLNAAV